MSNAKEDFAKRKSIVQSMNIMDDDFFHKVAEDSGAMEEVVSVLAKQKGLQLSWSRPQVFLRNCGARSVRVDALCKAVDGKLYSIEMEKSNKDNHQKRVRYNSSNIDTLYTEKGKDFKQIPELCMIYITKTDFLKGGRCSYHINRVIQENGSLLDNGMQEIYVNARIDDGSQVAQLMQYIKNTKGEHPLFPRLSARVKYLKEEQKGVEKMCKAVEDYAREKAREAARKAAKDSAVRLFQNGVSFEIVVKSITQLSKKELQQIYSNSL